MIGCSQQGDMLAYTYIVDIWLIIEPLASALY